MTGNFRLAQAAGGDAGFLVARCLEQLGALPDDFNFGLIYLTDPLAGELPEIMARLLAATPIQDWAGSVGIGICATGHEYFERPAMALLAARLPEGSYRLFGPHRGAAPARWGDGAARRMGVGLVHGDPRAENLAASLRMLAHDSEAYLVGGLSSARTAPWQVAGQVVEGGISGVLFDERVVIATGLSQGCAPIGPVRRVTRADRNTIIELDGRPALDCFKEDIGDLLARDLRRVAGLIFAGLPVPGSDCGDYLVRNLVSIDTKQGWIAIADEVGIGDSLLFCSRDRGIAARDFDRMLNDLKRRGAGRAQAGVYFSCVGRGPGFFSEPTEMAMIGAALGDIPIVGFFGNGEITYDRIYGHSGVLALFL